MRILTRIWIGVRRACWCSWLVLIVGLIGGAGTELRGDEASSKTGPARDWPTDDAFRYEVAQPELTAAPDDSDEVRVGLELFTRPAEKFHLDARPVRSDSDLRIWEVSFASPLSSDGAANDTVHGVLYEAHRGRGRHATQAGGRSRAGVVILHHLEDDRTLEEIIAAYLARRGVTALVMQLPFYGKRRGDEDLGESFVTDPEVMVTLTRQAVLDARRAFDGLRGWPGVDPQRVGLLGVSLGGINASIAAGVEPRMRRVALVLAGGDLPGVVFHASRETREVRRRLKAAGLDRAALKELWKDIEPLHYASRMAAADVLMLNARDDDVIPRRCTEMLWKSIGEPEIVWYPGDHTGMLPRLPDVFRRVYKHFSRP